jgi:hypothetical protein
MLSGWRPCARRAAVARAVVTASPVPKYVVLFTWPTPRPSATTPARRDIAITSENSAAAQRTRSVRKIRRPPLTWTSRVIPLELLLAGLFGSRTAACRLEAYQRGQQSRPGRASREHAVCYGRGTRRLLRATRGSRTCPYRKDSPIFRANAYGGGEGVCDQQTPVSGASANPRSMNFRRKTW